MMKKIPTQSNLAVRAWDWFGAKCDAHAWLAPVGLIALLVVVQALDAMDAVP